MTSMAGFIYTEKEMTILANEAKEQIIKALAHDDLLKGDPDEICGTYVLSIYSKGFFGRTWDFLRMRGAKKGAMYFAVLKSVYAIPEVDDDDDDDDGKEKKSLLKVVPISKGKPSSEDA